MSGQLEVVLLKSNHDQCSFQRLSLWPPRDQLEACDGDAFLTRVVFVCRRCGEREMLVCRPHALMVLETFDPGVVRDDDDGDGDDFVPLYCTAVEHRHQIVAIREITDAFADELIVLSDDWGDCGMRVVTQADIPCPVNHSLMTVWIICRSCLFAPLLICPNCWQTLLEQDTRHLYLRHADGTATHEVLAILTVEAAAPKDA